MHGPGNSSNPILLPEPLPAQAENDSLHLV